MKMMASFGKKPSRISTTPSKKALARLLRFGEDVWIISGEGSMRNQFLGGVVFVLAVTAGIAYIYPAFWWTMVITGPLIVIGFRDFLQTKHAILRNFPLLG